MMEQVNHNKAKILHIITVFSIGGATENTLLTADGFIKKGYHVDILTGPNILSEGDMYNEAKHFGVNVITLKTLRRDIHPFLDIISLYKIFRFLKKNDYDLIHTHSSKAGFIGRIAGKLAGTPIIIHTIHGLPFHSFQNIFVHKFYVLLEKIGSWFSDKIITVTEKIIRVSLENGIGKMEKFKVVRSGFNLSSFFESEFNTNEIRKKLEIDSKDIVIGKIARFSELKGHRYFIEAVEKIILKNPDIKIILVGSGELESQIRNIVTEKKLGKKIIYTGLIEYDKIPEIISVFDILVHTSLLEGLARVIPQAFLLKKPVVSFNIDGVSEVVINEVNGFTVPAKDSEKLADRIIQLVRDKNLRDKLGEEGFRLVKENWSQEKMVENLEKIYIELMDSKKIKAGMFSNTI